jgi:hypothetical protein
MNGIALTTQVLPIQLTYIIDELMADLLCPE